VDLQVNIPSPPFGSASTLDETKQQFRTDGWFNEKHGPEKLAKSYAAMNLRSRTTDKAGTGYHYREPLWH
jgi:hypothetical protein